MAAAGYGKTTALEADQPRDGVLCTAAEALAHGLPEAPWIGIDAFDGVDVDGQRELVRRLGALPRNTGICLASRTPLDPAVRSDLPGQFFERGPADLALEAYPIARLLAEEYGVLDPEAAPRVAALTAGWPALVHFAGDVLARQPDADLARSLTGPSSAAAEWLTSNVLADLAPDALPLLAIVAGLGPVTPGVCDRLAAETGTAPVGPFVESLGSAGVLVPRDRPGEGGVLAFVPVVGEVMGARCGPVHAGLLAAAAEAYEQENLPFPALQAYARAGAHFEVERLLDERGAEMVRRGDARGVADAIAARPSAVTPAVRRTHADALRRLGDGGGARRVLAPLVHPSCGGASEPRLATLLATALYNEGDLEAALQVLDGVDSTALASDVAGVEWRAARVRILSLLGRRDEARTLSTETLRTAELLGDPLALAEAHIAAARTSTGARKEAHLEDALRATTTTGDVVTTVLVLVNRSHLLLANARYAEAAVAAREAVRLADVSCPTGRLPIALHNLAEALAQTGDYDEAKWLLQRALAMSRRLGSGQTASGLIGIAEIHRRLGHDERAATAYEDAIGLARRSGELQVLVPALAGLARLQVRHDDNAAEATAAEAEMLATPELLPFALIALGWIAVSRGALEEARGQARRAVDLATSVQAFDLLAEALELLGVATDDPADKRAAFTRALAIWSDGGAAPAAARIEVHLGQLPGGDGTARSRAREAARLLQRLGVVGADGRPVVEHHHTDQVRIQVLGGFEVRLGGQPVPIQAWRSRQARTLVKILASRRGRPLTRDHLCELLWPDDDPAKTGHRLSVLLATVRGVLDPEKAWPADHFIAADASGLRLDLTVSSIDADGLLHDVTHGADRMEAGDETRAREILSDVDARYLGDAFEDELGEVWADGFREEVRAAWLRSLRRLATLRAREGRVDDAQGLLVRLLAVDPYDEQVHHMLVRTLAKAGRHGEARRAFRRWQDAMREIDAPLPEAGVIRLTDPPAQPLAQPSARRVRRPERVARVAVRSRVVTPR